MLDYKKWRDKKLENYQTNLNNCIVDIINPLNSTKNEKQQILDISNTNNFVIYQTNIQEDLDKVITKFNQQLGLIYYDNHLFAKGNGLSYIQKTDKKQGEFIPYTDKELNWHTDGYYNEKEQTIKAFTIHCVNPASSGGISQWFDYEIVYILLKEQNPDIIDILSNAQAMVIPNHKSRGEIFYIDEKTNKLIMRYSQRKKNITWLDSQDFMLAKQALDDLLATKTPYHFEHKLLSGQGIISNNVLHKRTSFVDSEKATRLMLRGRYYNRINILV